MKMKIVSCLLAVILLLTAVLPLSSCSTKPPELEDIYDRLVEIIETSHEINVVLFGAGLPVYTRGSEEDELLHRYYGVSEDGREFVSMYAKYASIEQIKAAAAEVYSESYRYSLFETLFTGFASDMVANSILPARYSEDEQWLYQNKNVEPLISDVRVYDYASMKIVTPSRGDYIIVEINSYTESYPEWTTIDLTFVYENNNWYLDGPSC